MLGPTHRLLGAVTGAAFATWQGQPWPMVAMTALVATATSNGPASPDMDQTRPWRAVARFLGPLGGHRHLTHWWGLPAAAWWALQHAPADVRWPAYALLAGWVSHLIGDLIFGKLPLFPWGGPRFGLGLDTGGLLETGRWNGSRVLPLAPTRIVLAVALVWVLAGLPSWAHITTTIGSHL